MEQENLTRVFICVTFPDEVINEIARLQESLLGWKFQGKMTELENIHVTLKFLGEIDVERVEKVRKLLREVKFDFFQARLSEIGTFSFRGMPRIVWVKVGGEGIFQLQKKIDDVLKGFFVAEKRFMSHLTLARVKYVDDKERFKKYVKKISVKNVRFTLDRFFLKKSLLGRMGPVYSVLEEIKNV